MQTRWDYGAAPAFPAVHHDRVRVTVRRREVAALEHLIRLHRLGTLTIESPAIPHLERAHASRAWAEDAHRTITLALREPFDHDTFWARMVGALERIEAVPREHAPR